MAEEHDLIVVGMGVAGEEVAGRAASAGMDVLAVDKKLVGGECPYWGCIPSKMMLRAGNSLAEAARVMGLAGSSTVSPSWAPVADRVRGATDDWHDQVAVERHEDKGTKVLHGAARLVGPRDVEVDGDRFTARRGLVISSGTEPAAPPIDGLEDTGYWTNREAIEATDVPRSLAVLGAGAVGLELGLVYSRFGAEVTIIEMAGQVLPLEEPENGEALGRALEAEGITVHTSVTAEAVRSSGGGFAIELSNGPAVVADKLLVATGREAHLAGLGVEAVGLDPKGKFVEVDRHLRAGDGIWAVGDVTGVGLYTHVAVYQGRVAAADILEQDHEPADYSAVPRVTFTDPEVASVGLSEAQAHEAGIDVATGVGETASSARGYVHGPGAEYGVTKLVADASRGILVGASTMGPAAGEVLGLLLLAVKHQVAVPDLVDIIYPYPTFVRGIEDALTDLGTL